MRPDRGTAAIEFAFAIMILLMLALGAYEWGTGFSDRISMTAAVREAGRVGSAAGDNPDADCRIIEASAGALQAVSGNDVKQLWIYESNVVWSGHQQSSGVRTRRWFGPGPGMQWRDLVVGPAPAGPLQAGSTPVPLGTGSGSR